MSSHSQTEAAEILKVTKQAISKVVNSVPVVEWNSVDKLLPQYFAALMRRQKGKIAVNQKRLTDRKSTITGNSQTILIVRDYSCKLKPNMFCFLFSALLSMNIF